MYTLKIQRITYPGLQGVGFLKYVLAERWSLKKTVADEHFESKKSFQTRLETSTGLDDSDKLWLIDPLFISQLLTP